MKLFNDTSLINAIWELTKRQYPEWDAPLTPDEGIADNEKNEDVDYSRDNNDT